MIEKAIEKLKAEMDVDKSNPNIQVIGEFLLEQLDLNDKASEKLIIEGKTIKGSIDEMKKVAKTKAVGGCGMLTDQEGFGIVLNYFDIKFTPLTITPIPIEITKVPTAPVVQDKKSEIEFNVELDF